MNDEIPTWLKLATIIDIKAGRLNRTDYVLLSCASGLIYLLLNILFYHLSIPALYGWVLVYLRIYFMVSFSCKRFRDFGMSGWWGAAYVFAPFLIGALLMVLVNRFAGIDITDALIDAQEWVMFCAALALALLPGQKGTNKYGEYFEIFGNPLRKIVGNKVKFFS